MGKLPFASTVLSAPSKILAVAVLAGAVRGAEEVKVYPPHSIVHGKTLMEWSCDWWRWVFSIPAVRNPVSDPNGQFAGEGQGGPVWFLAGTWFGMGPVTRTCTIPCGKDIFFPITTPLFCNGPGEDQTCEYWRDAAKAAADGICEPTCELDGAALPVIPQDHREACGCISIDAPPENVFFGEPFTFTNCASDGYWLMLEPLTPGKHTLHFTCAQCDGQIAQDITYELTVLDAVPFLRGDADGSGKPPNLTDAVATLTYLFLGGEAPDCLDAADVNDSGDLNLSDPIYLLTFLFLGGDPPKSPYPGCGVEESIDGLSCDAYLGCP